MRAGMQWYHTQCWWVSAEQDREAAEVRAAEVWEPETERTRGPRPERGGGGPTPDYCGKRKYEKRTVPHQVQAHSRQRTATERIGRAVYEAVANRKRWRQEETGGELSRRVTRRTAGDKRTRKRRRQDGMEANTGNG